MKLLSVGIHHLLGAPNKFNFSSDYNKIHPLIGALIIINLSSLSVIPILQIDKILINSWDSTFYLPNCKETKSAETLLFDPRLTPYPKALTFFWTHHPQKTQLPIYLSSPILHKQPTCECLTTIISVVFFPFERALSGFGKG